MTEDPSWVQPLADLLLDDRVDARPPITRDRALVMARRYRTWLDRLNAGPGEIEEQWREEARDWPPGLFWHTGKPTIVVAPQGHGKTNTASFLIQMALRLHPDWDVYTNLPFPWDGELQGIVPSPKNLHGIHDARALMGGIAQSILAHRVPAIALDEAGQWLSSHDWRSEAAEAMTKFVYVERHFRVRGPILVYHTWKSVLEPFRQEGDLRGSYCRVVNKGGRHRMARVEDQTRWFAVDETALPYLTLGQTGFDMNVDFQDLQRRLSGSITQSARQVLEYLAEAEVREGEEELERRLEARESRTSALADVDQAIADQHRAMLERREMIIHAFMENPGLTNRAAQQRYRASPKYLVELRQIALKRLSEAEVPAFPGSREATT